MEKIQLIKQFNDGTEEFYGLYDSMEEIEDVVQKELEAYAKELEGQTESKIICSFLHQRVTIH